ncbi:MAG: serine hydrolase, partial [Acidimicrobiales bacterium]
WEVASDGGIFSFRAAQFHGSMGGQRLNAPVVGMAATSASGGYWMATSAGGVFSFTAPFYGSLGGSPIANPIEAIAAKGGGGGYWLLPTRADPLDEASSYLTSRTGGAMAAVFDLTTGQMWSTGSTGPQDEASIVKVDILETLLAESNGQGLPTGDQALAQSMIEHSTNASATNLWYLAGGAPAINSYDLSAGLTATTPPNCSTCPGFTAPGWGLTTTTATDQIALLLKLVRPNSLLTDAERSYALTLMEHVTPSQAWGISGGVTPGSTVALKNGWLPLSGGAGDWQINSIGWVSGAGRNYLIAVLTTGNPSEQYGIQTIEQVSSDVWSALG